MPDDYGEIICGACEEGDDCPIHETGKYARPVRTVIDCRPKPVPVAIQRLLDEVAEEEATGKETTAYNRMHTRHNRGPA